MAITVTSPQIGGVNITQLLQPLIIKGDSDEVSEPKFFYLVELSVDGGVVAKFKYPPNPAGVVLADLSRIIESYLNPTILNASNVAYSNLPASGNNLFSPSNLLVKYCTVSITEYFAASATTSPTAGATASVSFMAFLSKNTFINKSGIDYNVYAPLISTAKFLTNSPRQLPIRVGEAYTLAFLNSSTIGTSADRVTFTFYDSAGVSLGSSSLTIAGGGGVAPASHSVASQNNVITYVGCGMKNLEVCSTASFKPSTYPTLAYYTVQLRSSGAAFSEAFRFNVIKDCVQTPIRIAFRNYFGTYDYFTFEGQAVKSTNVSERKTFTRNYGTWGSASFDYNIAERGETIIDIKADTTYKCSATFLSDADLVWLSEMIGTRDAYYISGSDIYPIIITTNNLPENKIFYNRVNNLEIEFKLSNKPNL
jgi:hypothetical protein